MVGASSSSLFDNMKGLKQQVYRQFTVAIKTTGTHHEVNTNQKQIISPIYHVSKEVTCLIDLSFDQILPLTTTKNADLKITS
jgi:hypothetical protein